MNQPVLRPAVRNAIEIDGALEWEEFPGEEQDYGLRRNPTLGAQVLALVIGRPGGEPCGIDTVR